MNKVKLNRIASNIIRELSTIMQNEASDELLKTITITGCEVSSDLSYAKVFFTSLISKDKAYLEKELKEASSFLRRELSQAIEVRHTPELVFIYDESVDYGIKIENIIKEINEKK